MKKIIILFCLFVSFLSNAQIIKQTNWQNVINNGVKLDVDGTGKSLTLNEWAGAGTYGSYGWGITTANNLFGMPPTVFISSSNATLQQIGNNPFGIYGYYGLKLTSSLTSSPVLVVGGATSGGSALNQVRISKGTSTIDIGEVSAGLPGIWFNQNTPSASNYYLQHDGSNGYFNATNSGAHYFSVNNGSALVKLGSNNYFTGNVRVGSAVAPTAALDVTGGLGVSTTATITGGYIYGTTNANFIQLDNTIGSKFAYNTNNQINIGNSQANMLLNGGITQTWYTTGAVMNGTLGVSSTASISASSYLTLNQNARTFFRVTNTTNGSAAAAGYEMNNNSGNALLFLSAASLSTVSGKPRAVNLTNYDNGGFVFNNSGGVTKLNITDEGAISINKERDVAPTATLDVTGTMSVSGSATVANVIINSNGINLTANGQGLIIAAKTINVTSGDAATINAPVGRFRKDTSGATFTLTNSFITANSIILVTFASDPGATPTRAAWITAGAGSCTINWDSAPTNDADVNFFIIN